MGTGGQKGAPCCIRHQPANISWRNTSSLCPPDTAQKTALILNRRRKRRIKW